ncbi:hypothetical protein WDV93_04550 [Pantoea ananatis]
MEAPRRLPWLKSVRLLGSNSPSLVDPSFVGRINQHTCGKISRMSRPAALYQHLTADGFSNKNAMVMVLPYGGKVNTVKPDETALPQRDSVMKVLFQSLWADAQDDQQNLDWIWQIYSATYADAGGVPVSNEITDGCFINYPDRRSG